MMLLFPFSFLDTGQSMSEFDMRSRRCRVDLETSLGYLLKQWRDAPFGIPAWRKVLAADRG